MDEDLESEQMFDKVENFEYLKNHSRTQFGWVNNRLPIDKAASRKP